MDSEPSVSEWIEDLKQGDSAAMAAIWNRFSPQLLRIARNKLKGLQSRVADEDDVVLSVMNSLFVAAQQGRFPDLADRKDLWRLLLYITACKTSDIRRHENRQKRGGNQPHVSLSLESEEPQAGAVLSDRVLAETLTPEFAAIFVEEFERLLSLLKNDRYRDLAIAKLKGYTNKELARQYGCSERTVERQLTNIRLEWQQDQER